MPRLEYKVGQSAYDNFSIILMGKDDVKSLSKMGRPAYGGSDYSICELKNGDILSVVYNEVGYPVRRALLLVSDDYSSCIETDGGRYFVRGNFRIVNNSGLNVVWTKKKVGGRAIL